MSIVLPNSPKVLIAIDFETADYKPDSACEIGMVRIQEVNGEYKIVDTFEAYIKPPREKFVFSYIHGITWEKVQFEEIFATVWQSAESFLKDVDGYIAHNASFDRKVLTECCIQHGLPIPTQKFYCTLKASRKFLKLKSHALNAVSEHFAIPLTHHQALADANASGQIFINLHNLGYNVFECKC